jgi:DNA-binding IclR family transcriptional regulator
VARRFHDVRLALGRPPKAATVLPSLAATTGHSAYLSRLVEGRVLVIEVAEGPASPYLEDLEVGLDASGHASALGKALLAALPHDQRRSYLREQGLPRFTSRTPTDLAALEHELSLLSPGSVVTEHGQFRNGVSCAATLVRPDGGEGGRWALGVSCRGEEVPVAVVGELLLATGALSRADDVPTR